MLPQLCRSFDAQAGYEGAMTMMATLHADADYIWHSAGWNEAGLHCSMAKFASRGANARSRLRAG